MKLNRKNNQNIVTISLHLVIKSQVKMKSYFSDYYLSFIKIIKLYFKFEVNVSLKARIDLETNYEICRTIEHW